MKRIDQLPIDLTPALADLLLIGKAGTNGDLRTVLLQQLAPLFVNDIITAIQQDLQFTGRVTGNRLTLTLTLGNVAKVVQVTLPAGGGGGTVNSVIGNEVGIGNTFLFGNTQSGGGSIPLMDNNTTIDNNTVIGN